MKLFGRFLYILIWPALWFIAPLTRRVRVVVSKKNSVLLVKHWIGPGDWQLPGGGIKRGEPVIKAAKREIKEELGFELLVVNILEEGPRTIRGNYTFIRLHFAKSEVSQETRIKTNWEIAEYRWFKVDNLPEIPAEAKIALDLAFKRVKS